MLAIDESSTKDKNSHILDEVVAEFVRNVKTHIGRCRNISTMYSNKFEYGFSIPLDLYKKAIPVTVVNGDLKFQINDKWIPVHYNNAYTDFGTIMNQNKTSKCSELNVTGISFVNCILIIEQYQMQQQLQINSTSCRHKHDKKRNKYWNWTFVQIRY